MLTQMARIIKCYAFNRVTKTDLAASGYFLLAAMGVGEQYKGGEKLRENPTNYRSFLAVTARSTGSDFRRRIRLTAPRAETQST